MLQMVSDTSGLTHTGGRDDHLGRIVKIDILGFFTGDGKLQSAEGDGVDSLPNHLHGLLIKALIPVPVEDLRGFHSQRTVHIDREILMPVHQLLYLDLAEKIQHLLGPSYRKGRNHHIAAPVKSLLQDLGQFSHIVRTLLAVQAVTVGGFHHHIIRPGSILGIPQNRLSVISQVTGEHDLLLHVVLFQPDLNTCRAQQMPHIRKPDPHLITDLNLCIIMAGDDPLDHPFRIFHGIERLRRLLVTASLRFSALPLSLHHLDMGTVTEHNAAQIRSCVCGIHLPPEASRIQKWQQPGMIHVGMGQEHIIDPCLRNGQRYILKGIHPLLHTVIHQNMFLSHRKIVTAAGHFVVRPNKYQFHRLSLLRFLLIVILPHYLFLSYHTFPLMVHEYFKLFLKFIRPGVSLYPVAFYLSST